MDKDNEDLIDKNSMDKDNEDLIDKMKTLLMVQQKIIQDYHEIDRYFDETLKRFEFYNQYFIIIYGISITNSIKLLLDGEGKLYHDVKINKQSYSANGWTNDGFNLDEFINLYGATNGPNVGPSFNILVGGFRYDITKRVLYLENYNIEDFNKLIKFANNLVHQNRLDKVNIFLEIDE
jgi:hypothetical protein